MDILNVSNIQSLYGKQPLDNLSAVTSKGSDKDFGSVFDAVMNMVDETNTLNNKAEAEQIKFVLGQAENTHDLAIAQQKANVALMYTTAVRDRFISAYQEIMQMQI